MEEENQLQLPVKELVRSDTNLERWAIFTTRKHTGERTLSRNTPQGHQTVEIGTTSRGGKQHTLTVADGKVWYAFLKMWEDAGRPTDKPIFFTTRSLLKDIGLKENSTRSKQIEERGFNLKEVPIRYTKSYKSPDQSEWREKESLTLLGTFRIFRRTKRLDGTIDKYFGFSEFKIHETIMDTILKKGMKPVRLDVIRTLKSDCAFILYRYLDRILFYELKHEMDLLEVAEICGLEEGQPIREIKRTISHALKELQGKDLSSGRIESAEIVKSKEKSGWKILVTKGKQVPALPASAVDPEKESIDFDSYFKSLSVEEQAQISKQAKEEAEQTLFYRTLAPKHQQEWIAGMIQSILKERIAQGKGIAPPLEAERGQETVEIMATKESVKERKSDRGNKGREGGKPAYAGEKVTYQNPSAQEVKIAGDWNGWQGESMTRETLTGAGSRESGTWYKFLDLRPGQYRYKLVVDGVWQMDPQGEPAGDEMGNNLLKISASGL